MNKSNSNKNIRCLRNVQNSGKNETDQEMDLGNNSVPNCSRMSINSFNTQKKNASKNPILDTNETIADFSGFNDVHKEFIKTKNTCDIKI